MLKLHIFKSYLQGTATETEREKENKQNRDFPPFVLLSKCLQKPGLARPKARSLELHQGLPHIQQELKCLSYYLLPSRMHQQEAGWKAG